MSAAMLSAGFADPALDAQRCFRALLEAMSRPGRVQHLPAGLLAPPAPLGLAAAAVLLGLADADTPVWLDGPAAAAGAWLQFHAGCPLLDAPGEASFALACGAPPALEAFAAGTEETPQDSATLVLQVQALDRGLPLRLAGPGIETEHALRVEGLPSGFLLDWARNQARFPRGVDVVLCAGAALVGLPRTVRIMEGIA